MSYSSIVKKKCKCGCGKYPTLSFGGYNRNCAPQDIKEKVGTKHEAAKRNAAKRSEISRNLHKEQNAVGNKLQELWFAKIAAEIRQHPYCWECNAWIAPEYYRHASAHIFAKNENFGFPSVATHPKNYLILGASCGCHDKTHRLDTFCKMGIWKEAVDRFKEFEGCITEKHKYLNQFKGLVYGKTI